MIARHRRLYFHQGSSPARILATRMTMVFLLVCAVMLVFWLDREQLRDNADGAISFVDVVYFTFVTVTTVGYGDIVPVGDRARLLDALFVTPIRIFVWFIFLGTAYQLVIQRLLENWKMRRLHDNLRDHIVIIGYGFEGRIAARELVDMGNTPEHVVVIDMKAERLEEASEAGFVGLRGDATLDEVLRDARVDHARAVLICTPRDDTTVLCVLSVRNLNPSVRLIASVREGQNIKLVRKAGADEAVTPAKLGGTLIAGAVDSRYSIRFINDLVGTAGYFRISEHRARREEIGLPLGGSPGRLLVAVERDRRLIGFWERPDERVQENDLVFSIESNGEGAPASGAKAP